MGLNIRINGVTSQNQFKLYYKTGNTVGNESVIATGYTQYTTGSDFSGGVYEKSTIRNYSSNPIIFTNASYSTQYWFKLYDTVTSGYTIENIYTNHQEYYDSCINCCYFSGGTAQYLVDCTFSGGTASYTLATPTPTSTPTATPTPNSAIWYFQHGAVSCTASYLEIMKNGSQAVLSTITSGGATGTLTVAAGDQLIIRVNTGQALGAGCLNAYVKYDAQQLVQHSPTGYDNAEINVTVTQNDINFGILICGTIGGGICPV